MAAKGEEDPKDLIHRAVITTDPLKTVTEYFRSRQEERSVKKYPEWDVPRVCPASELIKTKQELVQTQNALKAKRVEQAVRRKQMDERWDELRRQQDLLRQSFIKFNRFVRENYEKRERAEQKIKEEHERQITCQDEIKELTNKVEYLESVRDKMKSYIEEYSIYQTFLERVVNETGEFQSINDIFNRYEALVEAKNILSNLQDQKLQALEETGTEIHQMTNITTQTLMELNNKLAELQRRYDKAKVQTLKREAIVSRIKAAASAKVLELTQVRYCCWNMYQQICKRKGVPVTIAQDDIEHQLDYIKRAIQELKRIIKVAKKKAAMEEKS